MTDETEHHRGELPAAPLRFVASCPRGFLNYQGSVKGLPVITNACSLLVVDDEPYILATLNALLCADYEVVTADSAEAAPSPSAEATPDVKKYLSSKVPR